jgi:hypothetical protein
LGVCPHTCWVAALFDRAAEFDPDRLTHPKLGLGEATRCCLCATLRGRGLAIEVVVEESRGARQFVD